MISYGLIHTSAVLLLVLLSAIAQAELTPVIQDISVTSYTALGDDDGYFRDILLDSSNKNAYIGARNYVYKLKLPNIKSSPKNASLEKDINKTPNFGHPNTVVGADYDPKSEVKQVYDELNRRSPLILLATERLSQVYKLKNITYENQCKRQIKVLKLYYGQHLQLSLDDIDSICSRHSKGLAWLDGEQTKLIAFKNGILGTMPVAPTGVSDFDKGYPVWYNKSAELGSESYGNLSEVYANKAGFYNSKATPEVFSKIAQANRTCYSCGYSNNQSKCSFDMDRKGPNWMCYREYPIPYYMSTNYMCDFSPAPSRIVIQAASMSVEQKGPLAASTRESCSGGNLASTLLSGYHPDQVTKTLTSFDGNGEGNGKAVYILAEIGQEKQLDVNHEAFMGFEEPMPLTSSSSLALVRLMITANGDVDTENIVASNPFKETWVTSPLTKFGRLVKTGNQATVPQRPRAVALFEDASFLYFFFREVEWESMMHPEYTVNRHHYLWKVYDRTISYPWEDPKQPKMVKQPEKTDPDLWLMYAETDSNVKFNGSFNEHVYAPKLDAFKYTWDNARVVSRVGRVCKNDQGLPMGVQDASLFNLDNKLSLSAFQTFLKTKLTCTVKLKAVPRIWRQRADEFNFYFEKHLVPGHQSLDFCSGSDSQCINDGCGSPFDSVTFQDGYGVYCIRNKKGRNVAFRAFLDYSPSRAYFSIKEAQFITTHSGFSQTYWSYLKHMDTFSTVSYEYTELMDIQKVGGIIYGIFSSPNSEDREEGMPIPAASAVCKFSMADIEAAFNGPFKKRVNNAWRPVEGAGISPSPYTCAADPIRDEAMAVEGMDIDFTDETLPLEKELRNFDMRGKSPRLNFFEKDVEGSRTMWNTVEAEHIYSTADHQYTKMASANVEGITILYMATSTGEIHKLSVWAEDKNCWKTKIEELEKWWNEETNLKNNSWADYFTMTQESQSTTADRVFKSDWDCTPSSGYRLLSMYKPFGDDKALIWDMKLAGDQLIIAADSSVRTMSVQQCDKYIHCTTCTRDPHCGWDISTRQCSTYKQGLLQGLKKPANCESCLKKTIEYDPGKMLLLDATISAAQLKDGEFVWYKNDTEVIEKPERFLFTRNNSLAIIMARSEDAGVWELRDRKDKTCIVQYHTTLSDCNTPQCLYDKEHGRWCEQYESWQKEMDRWQIEMEDSGCITTGET